MEQSKLKSTQKPSFNVPRVSSPHFQTPHFGFSSQVFLHTHWPCLLLGHAFHQVGRFQSTDSCNSSETADPFAQFKRSMISRLQRIFIGSQISNMVSSLPETTRSSSDIGVNQEVGMISDELLSNSDAVDQITDDAAQLESVSESPEWANQRPGERKIECHTINGDAASSAGYSNSHSDGSQASIRSTSFMAYQSSGVMARQSLVGVTPDDAKTSFPGETVNEPNSSVTAGNSGLAGSIGGKSLN